jgi:hypothetical protein
MIESEAPSLTPPPSRRVWRGGAALNRLTGVTDADGMVSYTYDSAGF